MEFQPTITWGNVITILLFLLGSSGPLAWLIRRLLNDRQGILNRLTHVEEQNRQLELLIIRLARIAQIGPPGEPPTDPPNGF